MIAQLTGKLAHKDTNQLIIDVQGVGYEVTVTAGTFGQLPNKTEEISLHIYTHVTEGAISLFGFLDQREKALFKKLISVSGIGPKLAIQILSGLSVNELITALLDENLVKLTAIKGVGRKTAERIIVELRDKILELANDQSLSKAGEPLKYSHIDERLSDVYSALINLGYNKASADKALASIALKPEMTTEDVLKRSLSVLAR